MAAKREVVVVFAAQDQLSSEIQKIRNELGQVKTVGGAAAQGIEQINRSSAAAGTSIRAMATSTRFAATSMLSELNPAVGGAVAQLTSLGSVARGTGTIVGGVFVAAVGVGLLALGSWIKTARQAQEEQAKMNKALAEMDTGFAVGKVKALREELEKIERSWRDLAATARGTEVEGIEQAGGLIGFLLRKLHGDPDEARAALEKAEELVNKIRRLQFPGELAKLQSATLGLRQQFFDRVSAFEDPARPGRTFGDIDYAERVSTLAVERQHALARVQLDSARETALKKEGVTEEERLRITQAFNEQEIALEAAKQLALLGLHQSGQQARLKITEQWRAESLKASQAAAGEELAAFAKLNQERTQLVEGLLKIRDQFGEGAMLGAIQQLGPAIDENLIQKIKEADDSSVRRLNRINQALAEQQRQYERIGTTISNVFSDTLFDALEGRIEDFGQLFRRTMINVAREASRDLFQGLTRSLLGGRPGGGGGFPFDLGGVGQVAGVAAAGVPFGFTPTGGLLGQTGSIEAALNLGGRGLPTAAGQGGFLQSIFGQGFQLGPALGSVGVGLAGAGLGTLVGGAVFPGAETQTMMGAGIGALIGLAFGPLGAIIGGLAGGLIGGGLFGGKARKQQQALQLGEAAGGIANSIQSQAQSWAQDHPILGPVLLDAIATIGSYRTKTFAHAQRQLGLMEYLASLFAGRTPTPGEIYTWMQAADTPRFLGPDSLIFLLARPLEAIVRDETLLGFRADIPGVAGTLFEAEFGRLGIPGVLPLIQAGITPSGFSLETAMVDGMQRLRATQREIAAVENMSAAAVEALIFRLIRELERLGIPHGNLIEAIR